MHSFSVGSSKFPFLEPSRIAIPSMYDSIDVNSGIHFSPPSYPSPRLMSFLDRQNFLSPLGTQSYNKRLDIYETQNSPEAQEHFNHHLLNANLNFQRTKEIHIISSPERKSDMNDADLNSGCGNNLDDSHRSRIELNSRTVLSKPFSDSNVCPSRPQPTMFRPYCNM